MADYTIYKTGPSSPYDKKNIALIVKRDENGREITLFLRGVDACFHINCKAPTRDIVTGETKPNGISVGGYSTLNPGRRSRRIGRKIRRFSGGEETEFNSLTSAFHIVDESLGEHTTKRVGRIGLHLRRFGSLRRRVG